MRRERRDLLQFLEDVARKGEAVNTSFEERLFGLAGILHRISELFVSEVDLMVRRTDLDRIRSHRKRRASTARKSS